MPEAQLHLFRLPQPDVFQLTPMQRRVLDWAAFNERGIAHYPWPKRTLRRMIERGLIGVEMTPLPRYRLTAIGRLVRSSHHGHKTPTD